MLTISIKSSFPKRSLIFFATRPSFEQGFFCKFIQSAYTRPKFGFKRSLFYTKIADLTCNDITEPFSNDTKYQVRRALKEGISCRTSENIAEFVNFYNRFATSKNLEEFRLSENDIRRFGDNLCLRAAYSPEDQVLVYHSYLIDRSIKRVRGLSSASMIHDTSVEHSNRRFIGRANRFLIYQDMLYFKELGFEVFDFGGYAYNTKNKTMQGINAFKDEFGGKLIREANYEMLLQFLVKVVYHWYKNIASFFRHSR
jgi:hypothetical protein